MPINSNRKGKAGELAAAKFLQSLGFHDAHRTQQYNGLGKSDVECPETLPGVHIEVKRAGNVQDFRPGSATWFAACEQAERDAAGRPWVVLFKPSRAKWWLLSTDVRGVWVTVTEGDIGAVLEAKANQARKLLAKEVTHEDRNRSRRPT